MWRKILIITAICAIPAACAQQDPAGAAALQPPTVECANRETGIIKPASPGIAEVKLTGPFLVKSLAPIVDPANPNNGGSVKWSHEDAWMTISEFSGEFYLPEGETLSSAVGLSPWKTMYSGCRLE